MKSFLQDRKPTGSAPLRASRPARNAAPLGAVITPAGSGPQVEVIKEGEKIVRILVTCTCGERTEIECLYPANG